MAVSQPVRSLAAIVFTDVVGYSRLVHRDDANALRLVEEHFRLMRDLAARFGGRVIKTIGDSVHLEFASAQAATTCAIAAQQAHQQRNARAGEAQRFEIRIGVHLGDVEHRDGDVYGDGVNIAARLQTLAPAGGIAISVDVRRQLGEEMRGRFASRGTQDLKNITMPVEVFVIEAAAIAGITVDAPAAAPAQSRQRRWPPAWAVITVGVIALMMFIAKPWRHGPDAAPAPPEQADKSIAVLPFADLSAARDQEYFADGMAEELLNSLAQIKELKVAGRTSSFSFKGRNEDLRTIGKALGVAHVLEGSVRKQGDRVRVTAQLVQVANGYHLWSETYDRDLEDIFAVQSEIATEVAQELKLTLLGDGLPAQSDKPPNGNVEAYQAVLQGNFHYERLNRDDLRKAIAFYEHAVSLEPSYALAHARLARAAERLKGFFAGLPGAEVEALALKAHDALATATRLAPDSAETLSAQCQLLQLLDLQFAAAETSCRRLAELAPQQADAQQAYGRWLATMGRIEEALEAGRRAIAVDPLSASSHNLVFRMLANLGRYEEAESYLLKANELQPQSIQNHSNLAFLRLKQGRAQEAVALAEAEKDAFWRLFVLAFAYHGAGDRARADAMLQTLVEKHGADGAYQIAELYAFRNEPDKAFEWLDRAWVTRDPGVSLFLHDEFLNNIERDPRFEAFARKIGVR